jgi:hypothetical protein
MPEPKPSAWLYGPNDIETHPPVKMRGPEHGEPLYTREAIEAEIVAWLRDMLRADTNWPQVIAQKIERGEYRSKTDE